jgi:hypothetical protein
LGRPGTLTKMGAQRLYYTDSYLTAFDATAA